MTTDLSKSAGDTGFVRSCTAADFNAMLAIINDAAMAYRGVIPEDCWHDPYMQAGDLTREIAADIRFAGYEQAGTLIGVTGTQPVQDVTLIRHAYVSTRAQRLGVGTALLQHLRARTDRPILIGTWAAAKWAIQFYERQGFQLIDGAKKNALLKKYWTVPDPQIDASVVLADARWQHR